LEPLSLLKMLFLLMLANGSPVIAKRLFGDRFALPVDGGANFIDGRRLFGESKTIRGILLALTIPAAGAPLVGLEWTTGLWVGAAAMIGDLFSSFTKRRLGMPAHSMALGLDQVPESLLPLLVCRTKLGLSAIDIVVGVLVFLVGSLLLSRLLYRYGIRERPY
jgi:CDP-2,3-bis-(O-geranylgeranyl)-sn-glycerol synthase